MVDPYDSTSTRPGYSDRYRKYSYLQSRRVFRYQPGRISGFTFGLRSSVEPVTGITLEWGIANNSDQYIFQIDAGQFYIIRRSTIPLEPAVLIRNGLTSQDQSKPIPSGDPFDGELYWTIKIPDDKFNGDVLNGNGPSGYNLKPENVTMYKIEFGWYGAIGARFYAYIPTGNGDARWVVIHTLVIENSLGAPCLRDSYFRFKYSLNVANTGDVRTPQYLYKYGASYYIDGGDEGTSQIYSASSKQKTIRTTGSKSLIGIYPKKYLLNREGDEIKNKKLIIPETLNVSTDSLTEVKVVTCKACPGFGHVYTPGIATTENGRYINASFDTSSSIVTVGSGVYFTKDDIGAKIIAPSIYNAYIYDVPESSRVSGTNNYTRAELKRFGGLSGSVLETKPIAGELVLDRVLGITTTIGIGITYPYQIRLSNYNATAASDFEFSGSSIEIQFVNPNNGDDYAHFADFLIGITDKKPIVGINTLGGFTLPGIGNTSILSNSQILYGEHTHSWAAADEDGVEVLEAWASPQPPLRMGIDNRIPYLSAPAGGVCSKVTVDVLDPLEIKNVNEKNYLPSLSGTQPADPEGRRWIEVAGEFDRSIDFAGGQIAIRSTIFSNVNVDIVRTGLVLNLDAANKGSYSQNYHPNPTDIFSWYSSNSGSSNNATISRSTIASPVGNTPLQMVTTGNDSFIDTYNQTKWSLGSAVSGQTWTVSVWAKASVATTGEIFIFEANSSGGAVQVPFLSINITTEWQRFSYSYTFVNGTTTNIQTRLDGANAFGSSVTIWWDGLQVERSSSVTDFTSSYTGDNILNLLGNGNNGTLVNGPSYNGSNGGSIVFDGVDDYVIVDNSLLIHRTSNWAYSAWVNFSATPIQGTIFENGSWTNTLLIRFETNGITIYSMSSYWGKFNFSPTLGAWYKLDFIRNGNNIDFYLNGSYSQSMSFTADIQPSSNLFIGMSQHSPGQSFNGRIATTQIYNRALTAAEVAQNYNSLSGRYGLPPVATFVSIPTTEIVTVTNSKFVGVTSSYTINDNGVEKEFSYIQISQTLGSVGSNFTILVRPVSITGTTISKQKLYNYNPWPLYLVAKLKDNAAINNISVKETIGDFQRTISPKWYVSSNCTVTTADGNADPTGTAPTNFQEIDRSSSALIDIQNDQTLRPYIERDTLYVGADSTESINMRKIFGPDRSVITPDNNNIEATFIIAKKIEKDTGPTGIIEASINFKEQ